MKVLAAVTLALVALLAVVHAEPIAYDCYSNGAYNDPICYPPTNPNGDGHAFWDKNGAFGGPLYFKTADGLYSASADIKRDVHENIKLTGYLGNANYLFELEVDFTNPMGHAMYTGNGGVVKEELNPICYGPSKIDTASWVFYDFTGTLTAVAGSKWAGGVITINRSSLPKAHFGAGANQKNTGLGMSAWVDLQISNNPNPADAPTLSTSVVFDGDFNININCPEICVPTNGDVDANCVNPVHPDFAVWIPGLCTDLVFQDGESWQEKPNSATLTGKLVCASDNDLTFNLVAEFKDRVLAQDAAANDIVAKLEGCAQNDAQWFYYKEVTGKLYSTGAKFAGGVLSFSRYLPNGAGFANPAPQIGWNANGKNTKYGLAAWIALTLVQPGTTQPTNPTLPVHGDININLCPPQCCAASDAEYKQPCNNPAIDAHSIWLPQLCTNLIWESGVGLASAYPGINRLQGTLVCQQDAGYKFEVDLYIANKIDYSQLAHYGVDAKEEGCNVGDLANDYYFVETGGVMKSIGTKFAGGVIQIFRAQPNGAGNDNPIAQLGPNANGKNQEKGVASWFEAKVVVPGTTAPMNPTVERANTHDGDININICGHDVCEATDAEYEAPCNNPAIPKHAVWLPAICGDGRLIFDSNNGQYTEQFDQAELSGVVYCTNDPAWRFKILVVFEDRVAYADIGAEGIVPKIEGCGNPSGFSFFKNVRGELISIGTKFTGGVIAIERALPNGMNVANPATQYGFNANGKNANFGMSSWFYAHIIKDGTTAPTTFNVNTQNGQPGDRQDGDINIDLCPPVDCSNRVTCSPSFEVSDCQYNVMNQFCLMLAPYQFQNGCWKVTSGEVDLKGTYWVAFNGAKSIDLNGRRNGQITSASVNLSGGTWRLSFWYAGNPFDDVVKTADVVLFDANTNMQYHADNVVFDNAAVNATPANMQWVQYQADFTLPAAADVQIQFTSTQADDNRFGVAVDMVSIVPAVCP